MPKECSICPLCQGKDTVFLFHDKKNYQHCYHHCLKCDLVFVLPEYRLTLRAEKARYDMHHNGESLDYVQFLSRLAEPMLQHLDKPKIGIDFGSGRSQAMANLFRQQGHTCKCYDVFYYPDNSLLTKQYDFIIASEVIEHLYEPKKIIEQWLQMLNPSGLLGIMTGMRPDKQDFPHWWYKNDPTHVGLYSLRTLDYLASRYQLTPLFQHRHVTIFQTPH